MRQLAGRQHYVLVSPYPDLPTPVVASAWSRQVQLGSVDDPRLEQFITAFRLGLLAPERGGPCTGGVGEASLLPIRIKLSEQSGVEPSQHWYVSFPAAVLSSYTLAY